MPLTRGSGERGMKKAWVVFLALLLAVGSFGCGAKNAQTDGSQNTASSAVNAQGSPGAQKTPEPEALKVVFGKDKVTIAVVSNGNDEESKLFFDAVSSQGESMGITVETKAAGDTFKTVTASVLQQDPDCLIVYLPHALSDASALQGVKIPVCVFQKQAGTMPAGMSVITYDNAKELDMVFDAVLKYPPHDTPVRLFGLFTGASSSANARYNDLTKQGKVMQKKTWIADNQTADAAKQWVAERLQSYYPGMVDAVFAETDPLAIAALDALEAANRTDMEVFTVGVTDTVLGRMEKNPDVFAQAVGCNDVLAGAKSVRIVLSMLKGGAAVTETMEPTLINAPKQTVNHADYMLEGADVGYLQDWMTQLQEYYKK